MARLHSPGCRGLSSSLLGTFLAISCLILLPTLWLLYEPRGVETSATAGSPPGDSRIIMGKLGNATAKAELGRASWKLLHTMAARYPEKPSPDQRKALSDYLHLFARLYPCGECAAEFAALLDQYPPQTSSRSVASIYLCDMHNHVNARLGKPEFDCVNLEGLYDCGCGDDAPKTAGPDDHIDPLTGDQLVHG